MGNLLRKTLISMLPHAFTFTQIHRNTPAYYAVDKIKRSVCLMECENRVRSRALPILIINLRFTTVFLVHGVIQRIKLFISTNLNIFHTQVS